MHIPPCIASPSRVQGYIIDRNLRRARCVGYVSAARLRPILSGGSEDAWTRACCAHDPPSADSCSFYKLSLSLSSREFKGKIPDVPASIATILKNRSSPNYALHTSAVRVRQSRTPVWHEFQAACRFTFTRTMKFRSRPNVFTYLHAEFRRRTVCEECRCATRAWAIARMASKSDSTDSGWIIHRHARSVLQFGTVCNFIESRELRLARTTRAHFEEEGEEDLANDRAHAICICIATRGVCTYTQSF